MERRKFLTLSGAALGTGAIGLLPVALGKAANTPPTMDQILTAMDNNLLALSGVSATVACVGDTPARSFVGGTLRARGQYDFRLDRGTMGDYVLYNSVGWNRRGMQPGGTLLYMIWNRPDVWEARLGVIHEIGVLDLRSLLWFGRMHPMTVAPTKEQIGLTLCWRCHGDGYRLWVDPAALHRIVYYEVDYSDGNPGFFGFFSNWLPAGGGQAEMPVTAELYWVESGTNFIIRDWRYQLGNVAAQQTFADSVFAAEFPTPFPTEGDEGPPPTDLP